jgi:hypothetical protein
VRLTGSNGPSGSNSFDQAVESKEVNPPAIELADEGWARIGGDDQKVRFGVRASEDQQAGRIEIASRPFAFDGQRGLTPGQPDEVNLVALLVAPVAQSGCLQLRREFVQDGQKVRLTIRYQDGV